MRSKIVACLGTRDPLLTMREALATCGLGLSEQNASGAEGSLSWQVWSGVSDRNPDLHVEVEDDGADELACALSRRTGCFVVHHTGRAVRAYFAGYLFEESECASEEALLLRYQAWGVQADPWDKTEPRQHAIVRADAATSNSAALPEVLSRIVVLAENPE
jgi:hypothetical protein